MNNLYH